MKAYIIRRLLLVIPTLFLLSILVFLSVRFIPGDVIDAMLSEMQWVGGDIDRETLERRLGLDVPSLGAVWTLDRRDSPARQPGPIPVAPLDGRGGDILQIAGHH